MATTSFPALTTTFTPPPGCVGTNIYWSTAGAGFWYDLYGLTSTSTCFPPSYNPTSTFHYSPGVCPLGYTPVPLSTAATPAITTQLCCPSHNRYNFGTRPTTLTTAYDFQTTLACEYNVDSSETFVVAETYMTSGTTTSFSRTLGGGMALNAYGIYIQYRAADFVSTTSTIPSISTSTPTSTPPSQSSAIPTNTSSPSSGLTTGAKAGIGIGVAASVIALASAMAAAYLLMRKRKMRNAGSSGQYAAAPNPQSDLAEWEGPQPAGRFEGSERHELAASALSAPKMRA